MRLTLIWLKDQCLPLRWSSTVRLPFLESEFAQIMAVEAVAPSPIDPRQQAGDILDTGAQRPRHARFTILVAPYTESAGAAVAIGRLLAPATR